MAVHMLRLQARVDFSETVASVLQGMMMGKCTALQQQPSSTHTISRQLSR